MGKEIRKQAAGTEELEGPALFLTHRQIMGLQTDKDRDVRDDSGRAWVWLTRTFLKRSSRKRVGQ